MGDLLVPGPDPQVLCFPFYSDFWEHGELQREVGSPVLFPVCALADPAWLGGEGGRAVHICLSHQALQSPEAAKPHTPASAWRQVVVR